VTSATFKYDRIPFLVRFEEDSLVKETYAGRLNTVALEGQLLKPHGSASDTVLVFMHPSGTMNYLPFPIAMAQAGHHVMCVQNEWCSTIFGDQFSFGSAKLLPGQNGRFLA
jgi:hypothetical protein